jgi:hypothetical protein
MLQVIRTLSLVIAGIACQAGARPGNSAAARGADVPRDTVITLERTVCFGTCPDYKIIIHGDGRLVYEGRRFVKTVGAVESTVTQEQLRQLVAEFEKADYFSLCDEYPSSCDRCPTDWTDNPSANTSIQINGKKKSIRHYYGCQEKSEHYAVYPQKLYQLESRIDEIVGSARWVAGKTEEKKDR